MSYRNCRLMPHPVLSVDRDDYQPGYEFSADVPLRMISDGGRDITITVQYQLNVPTLCDLIERGQARYCTVVECPKTYRRSSHTNVGAEDIIMLRRQEYDGRLVLTPYIAAVDDIVSFNPSELNEEFRQLLPADGAVLPVGAILAIGLATEISLETPSAVESIIDLVPNSNLQSSQFAVDLTGQRIAINVHPSVWVGVQQVRNRQELQPILHQALYLHAIDKAIRSLSDNEDKRWAEVISRKLVDGGVEVDDEESLSENSETHAQQIFQNPLERMLTALQ
jgi:hypothetical protein